MQEKTSTKIESTKKAETEVTSAKRADFHMKAIILSPAGIILLTIPKNMNSTTKANPTLASNTETIATD